MREEKGIIALLTVTFLAFVGVIALALVLAAAKINNSYTLLNNAAQAAAFSAVTAAEVESGEAVIPCDNTIRVRETERSGCTAGEAWEASNELLKAAFIDSPGGFCFSSCAPGETLVHLGEEGGSWIQVFNTVDNQTCAKEDFQVERDALLFQADPPRFQCWVIRKNRLEKPYSIRYSSGAVVRLKAKIDLFIFEDRDLEVYAGATISQGE